ncbi:MAG TPA: Holliday junction resolvase RuvX [Dehalococcoidia bacterium]|nr:Holliday junction resolvase RuvX [Dehalococcoidia bacterium]
MRVLGLDVGDRRIGLALSDPLGILASGLGALERRDLERDIQAILALVEEKQAERIVVGLPKRLDGSLGEQARKVQELASSLSEVSPVPVEYWDERLSTVAAQQLLRQAGAKKASRGRVDAAAASVILQGYLDAKGPTRPEPS